MPPPFALEKPELCISYAGKYGGKIFATEKGNSRLPCAGRWMYPLLQLLERGGAGYHHHRPRGLNPIAKEVQALTLTVA